MTSAKDLVAVLRQVRHTTSPLQRLKILGRAGKDLLSLSPPERLLLARELGVDGAEHLLELVARKSGGVAPEELVRLVEQAEKADPEELKEMLDGLRRGDRKQLGQALAAAAQWAEGDGDGDGEEEEDRDGEGEGEGEQLRGEMVSLAAVPGFAAAVPSGVPGASAATQVSAEVAEVPGTIAEQGASVAEEVRKGEQLEGGLGGSAELPGLVAVVPGASVEVSDTIADGENLVEMLRGTRSLVRRLRTLDSRSSELSGASLEELRGVLGLFPAGWARRRAVESLLRTGAVHGPGEEIALVGELASPLHRFWVLSGLADRRDLSECADEALGLFEQEDPHRRRLARRIASRVSRYARAG